MENKMWMFKYGNRDILQGTFRICRRYLLKNAENVQDDGFVLTVCTEENRVSILTKKHQKGDVIQIYADREDVLTDVLSKKLRLNSVSDWKEWELE